MKPVIQSYKDNQFIWSKNYTLLSKEDGESAHLFLQNIEKNYFDKMKILKINFSALDKNTSLNILTKTNFVKTDPIHVFILNEFEIISRGELVLRLADLPIQQTKNLTFKPLIQEFDFKKNIESIKKDIAQGRFYQINFTSGFITETNSDFLSLGLFAELINTIHCPYASYLPLKDLDIVCLSPELFLKKENDLVTTQPIKGTLTGAMTIDDLQKSEKESAELSMIVDLLRNDLNSLSCEKYTDSSRINFHKKILDLGYTSHTYSEVEIKSSKKLADILSLTFPGGSISGCPKKESLLKINEIEDFNRDFYTGSIGWWIKNDFTLNIAIRSFAAQQSQLFYFTGCGVVYDSDPQTEWAEFLRKASFLKITPAQPFVIDTLKLTKEGFTFFNEHVDRTFKALNQNNQPCSLTELNQCYQKIQSDLLDQLIFIENEWRIKLIFLNKFQNIKIEIHPLAEEKSELILELCKKNSNKTQTYKTTDRKHWIDFLDQKSHHADDILAYNEQAKITETSRFNVFYKIGNEFYTPPLSDGALAGTFRAYVLKLGQITVDQKIFNLTERSLDISELPLVDIYVGNSVRGLIKCKIYNS